MKLQEKKFQKRIEDFICKRCKTHISGTGYTDHCPNCLWSKHVDINPGDRKAKCGGLMEPVGVEIKGGKSVIYYRCQKCGFKSRVKAAPNDNFEEILRLVSRPL